MEHVKKSTGPTNDVKELSDTIKKTIKDGTKTVESVQQVRN